MVDIWFIIRFLKSFEKASVGSVFIFGNIITTGTFQNIWKHAMIAGRCILFY